MSRGDLVLACLCLLCEDEKPMSGVAALTSASRTDWAKVSRLPPFFTLQQVPLCMGDGLVTQRVGRPICFNFNFNFNFNDLRFTCAQKLTYS